MNKLEHFQEFHRTYKEDISLPRLTAMIREGTPVIFLKFGDGEVECMKVTDSDVDQTQGPKHNCDSDVYYPQLSQMIKAAFLYFSYQSHAKHRHVYLGKWHYHPEIDYLSKLTYTMHPNKPIIPFANYHLVMNDKGALKTPAMQEFVRTIRDSPYHKIIISNPQNRLLQTIFAADAFMETPEKCLFLQFDKITEAICKEMDQELQANPDQKFLLLTSCGLSAKALVYVLYQKYCDSMEDPTKRTQILSAIDLGSSFDLLCKKRVTRAYQYEYTYEELHNYYQEFL